MSGLYVHIPFCRAKCAYCDFYSGPLRGFSAEAYTSALTLEHQARSRTLPPPYDTVYIGGGTPSTISPRLLAPFAAMAKKGAEVTIEVNPEDVDTNMAEEWLRAGFNRVSMGVQSLIDTELKTVGRRHSAAQAVAAFHSLRRAGFDNISIDLIYGLPGQTANTWSETLQRAISLRPEHLSAYSLQYEPGTLLHAQLQTGRLTPTPEDDIVEMYTRLCSAAADGGYEHYEISNFALPSKHSRHNSSYWNMTPYLGLGPGAHSFDGNCRYFNPSDLKKYLAAPGRCTILDPETDTDRYNDMIMVALRTSEGIDPSIFTAEELRHATGILIPTPSGRLRISEADWLRADPITASLFR